MTTFSKYSVFSFLIKIMPILVNISLIIWFKSRQLERDKHKPVLSNWHRSWVSKPMLIIDMKEKDERRKKVSNNFLSIDWFLLAQIEISISKRMMMVRVAVEVVEKHRIISWLILSMYQLNFKVFASSNAVHKIWLCVNIIRKFCLRFIQTLFLKFAIIIIAAPVESFLYIE